jgi:flagellar basal body-associated protein FliL
MSEENPGKNNKLIIIVVVIIIVLALVGYWLVSSDDQSDKSLSSPDSLVDPGNDSQTGDVSKPNVQGPQVEGSVFMEAVDDVNLGDEVEVMIRINTGMKNITLTKVVLEYDPHVLQWQRVDGTNSVLPLAFRQENKNGKIIISRGVTGDADWQDSDDGYTGADGLFASVVFKAVGTGVAQINLVSGETRMFLDDGRATDVNLTLESVDFEIK